ncbi:MAG: cobalamin-binding protein [Patescibacteria group bacterium]
MNSLRILSLLPAATEMVYLLGLEKYLVGVSHECDYPPQAKLKPKVTSSLVSNAMSSKEIDEKVKKGIHRGPGIFHIKEGILKDLRPNLILTQELCEVCAISPPVILRSKATKNLKIISLEPESVDDILENILLVGQLTDRRQQAKKVVNGLEKRLLLLRQAQDRNDGKRLGVLVIEWLDPIMVAGHWIPEMVDIAGGVNLMSKPGEKSKKIKLHQITTSKLGILIISPCGFDIQRTINEKKLIEKIVRIVGEVRVYIMDGNAYMTRPGPRIVDGIEVLAEILYPNIFPKKHSNKDWILFK